jgi:hypothetical protein
VTVMKRLGWEKSRVYIGTENGEVRVRGYSRPISAAAAKDFDWKKPDKSNSHHMPGKGYLLLVEEFLRGLFKDAGKNRLAANKILSASEHRNIPQYALYEVAKMFGIETEKDIWTRPQKKPRGHDKG